MSDNVPVQPVENPILCNPYEEPNDHWLYDRQSGQASHGGHRRPAGYYYKTERTGPAQRELFGQEEHDLLPLVNLLRDDVRAWRQAAYPQVSPVSRDLLRHWARADRPRRLFFCQREAVETLVYLAELCIPGKPRGRGNQKYALGNDDIRRLLEGVRPSFIDAERDFFPTLADRPADEDLRPLCRLGCKMATGSGKTVVMAMLVAWAFCNRAHNPASTLFPDAVLVLCPNLTVKERLQVLRPGQPGNYYEAFDLVPLKYRELLHRGKVLVTNWHALGPESEHVENGKSYAVVHKGPETADVFARRVLGDLYDRLPLLVLNDEGHHCWRPAPTDEKLTGEERSELEVAREEATVWIEGLDRINNARAGGAGVGLCVDLSATPFYLKGSGHPEGRPFPWLVSDFGLVDAIESGIVKVPRLPVQDTTGRPVPKYFRLWETINAVIGPAERLPGRARKPKPEAVYRECQPALQQIAGQWVQRFRQMQEATPGQERVPPVLIVVCDNTDIADVFFRKISGESEEDVVGTEDVEEMDEGRRAGSVSDRRVVYGPGDVFPEYFSNVPGERRTIRIDSKLLEKAERGAGQSRAEAAEELRRIVATVGRPRQPGEHVRCVVSVAMLTEGWDAQNVTHILGVRAFGSQLLCEQVVGRGLRRMSYTPDPQTGRLTEENVDVYGIPFSVIPFKGRPVSKAAPEDRPKNHVRALPERAGLALRFPVVEGYAFALRHGAIRCDVEALEELHLEPNREPTATFLLPTVGIREGAPARGGGPFGFVEQDRQAYYQDTHPQTIRFQIARLVVDRLLAGAGPSAPSPLTPLPRGERGEEKAAPLPRGERGDADRRRRVLRLQSRHQLFPQVYRYVEEYAARKVRLHGCHPCELGLEKYVTRLVERLGDAIEPDGAEGEPPLLPVLNRYKPIGTTADVSFFTVRPVFRTQRSHIDQVVADTQSWESAAAFRLEQSPAVRCYARNDHLGLVIPYEYQGVDHVYEPDFLVRLTDASTVVLEMKGYEDEQSRAKHAGARRWVSAVNNWGELGVWRFHLCRDPQALGQELAALCGG